MLIKAYNQALIQDREKTFLTSAAASGATALTVASTDLAAAGTSSNTWADNDYVLVGNFGEETTEIVQMAAAVTSATSLTIDREGQAGGLRHAHPVGTPVYRLDFNRVTFYRNTTNSTSGVTTLTTIPLQADDLFTRYEDQSNTTGFAFVRFNNQTTGAFSSYSDGVNYEVTGEGSSRDPKTLWTIRKRVRKLLDEPSNDKLSDQDIDDAVNDKQRDIAHLRLWSFYETERSFSSVADQFAYDIPSTVQKAHTIRFDTQPLINLPRSQWELYHWDTDQQSSDPTHSCIWNNQLLVWPRPPDDATADQLNGGITASATTITVDSTSGFNRGDYYRFIIDDEVIYATASTTTTFTDCLRGQEGTTATAHSDDSTVTERDIVYTAHVEPTNLIDIGDRTAIPESDVLAFGVAADLALLLENEILHDRLKLKYDAGIKMLEDKYAMKQTSQFGRVKIPEETVQSGPLDSFNSNLYPRDLG